MSNKLILLLTGVFATVSVVAQQKPFTITGKIEGKTGTYIYLAYPLGDDKYLTDSSLIENGKFSFNGQLQGPVQASLMIDRKGRTYDKYKQLYLVPANMQLAVMYSSFENVKLTGSPVQVQADELEKMRSGIMARMKPLSEAYNKANNIYIEAVKAKKDEATLASFKEAANTAKDAMDPLREEYNKVDLQFMDKYPSSFVTASILRSAASHLKHKELEERYSKLSPEVKNSSLGKEVKKNVDELRMGSPGAKAFQFASEELRGGQLKLTDFKGKYVLVDFWASWCVPCRKGNPHLLSLYAKYKEKGLEIIGVSDDDNNHEAWKKAVDKDSIGVWKHVLRGLKRVDAPEMFDRSASIADKYGIHSLPTKILIDPNGVIIGRFGGGGENDQAMDKKLTEIFGG